MSRNHKSFCGNVITMRGNFFCGTTTFKFDIIVGARILLNFPSDNLTAREGGGESKLLIVELYYIYASIRWFFYYRTPLAHSFPFLSNFCVFTL